MKVKTSELTDKALDYAVAVCRGFKQHAAASLAIMQSFNPSSNWTQAGPIIEREKITIESFKGGNKWSAFMFSTGDCEIAAETPLIAAMRCYVASKFGESIEVPDELI